MRQILNRTGIKYGRLLVVSFSHQGKGGVAYWNCVCDCGKEKVVNGNELGRGNTRSCGCYKKIWSIEANRKEKGEANKNALFLEYKNQAERRGIDFDLSRELFTELTSSNCYYCGVRPSSIKKNDKYFGDYPYNGIDRKDCSLGYIATNCVAACWPCNRSKATMDEKGFLAWIQRVYNHSIEKL